MAVTLLDTGLEVEWILETLEGCNREFVEARKENGEVLKLDAEHISEGKGFLSRVYRVSALFQNGKRYSFVLKIPAMSVMDDACDKTEMDSTEKIHFHNALIHSHNVECDAYQLLHNIKNFPIAKVYFIRHSTDEDGLIIMEDLCDKTTCLSLNVSPTPAQCFNVARHIAHFQAYINFIPGQPWRNHFKSIVNFHVDRGNVDQWPKYMRKLADIEPKFIRPAETMLSIRFMDFCEYALLTDASTLWHGDTWVNNIRMQKCDDGSVSDQIAAFLDWQIVYEGNPLFDIARWMVYCVDAEIRREIEEQVVNCYYDKLTELFKEEGNEGVKFTRDQAHEMYQLAAIHQAFEQTTFVYFMCAQLNRQDTIHEARAAKLILRSLFACEDSAERMKYWKIDETFKR